MPSRWRELGWCIFRLAERMGRDQPGLRRRSCYEELTVVSLSTVLCFQSKLLSRIDRERRKLSQSLVGPILLSREFLAPNTVLPLPCTSAASLRLFPSLEPVYDSLEFMSKKREVLKRESDDNFAGSQALTGSSAVLRTEGVLCLEQDCLTSWREVVAAIVRNY